MKNLKPRNKKLTVMLNAVEQTNLKYDARKLGVTMSDYVRLALRVPLTGLTDEENELLLDALESHAYWQVSEEQYRRDGYVYAPGADDEETAELLQTIDRLSVKLGGELITGMTEPNGDEEESAEMGFKEKLKADMAAKNEALLPLCAFEGCKQKARHGISDRCAQHDWIVDDSDDSDPPAVGAIMCVVSGCPATAQAADGLCSRHWNDLKEKVQCVPGEHDFDINEAHKDCNRCGLRLPFPNTRGGLLSFVEMRAREMVEIMHRKNADYAGLKGTDPFANFTRVEALGICKTEVGFLTRMTDKLCRISSFVERGELSVKDESVQDTLKDLANYSLLMLAFLESKKEGK